MLLDAVALGILSAFILLGLLRGGLASGMALVNLAASYAVAVLSAQHLGPKLAHQLEVPALLGPALAGMGGFAVTGILLGLSAAFLKRWVDEQRGDEPRSALDRGLGATFGAVRGVLVVLLLAWLAIWLDAARDSGAVSGLRGTPETEHSVVAGATEAVVERGVEAALSDSGPGGRLVARVLARPGKTLESMQSVLDSPRIQALQNDGFFWTLVENGASERAMNRRSFQDVLHDQALREQLAQMGLIDAESAQEATAFRQAASRALEEVGPRLKRLTSDPDLRRLATDPEVATLLQSGDTMGLLRHEGFQNLLAKLSSEL